MALRAVPVALFLQRLRLTLTVEVGYVLSSVITRICRQHLGRRQARTFAIDSIHIQHVLWEIRRERGMGRFKFRATGQRIHKVPCRAVQHRNGTSLTVLYVKFKAIHHAVTVNHRRSRSKQSRIGILQGQGIQAFEHFREHHDITYYADKLCITPHTRLFSHHHPENLSPAAETGHRPPVNAGDKVSLAQHHTDGATNGPSPRLCRLLIPVSLLPQANGSVTIGISKGLAFIASESAGQRGGRTAHAPQTISGAGHLRRSIRLLSDGLFGGKLLRQNTGPPPVIPASRCRGGKNCARQRKTAFLPLALVIYLFFCLRSQQKSLISPPRIQIYYRKTNFYLQSFH